MWGFNQDYPQPLRANIQQIIREDLGFASSFGLYFQRTRPQVIRTTYYTVGDIWRNQPSPTEGPAQKLEIGGPHGPPCTTTRSSDPRNSKRTISPVAPTDPRRIFLTRHLVFRATCRPRTSMIHLQGYSRPPFRGPNKLFHPVRRLRAKGQPPSVSSADR